MRGEGGRERRVFRSSVLHTNDSCVSGSGNSYVLGFARLEVHVKNCCSWDLCVDILLLSPVILNLASLIRGSFGFVAQCYTDGKETGKNLIMVLLLVKS